MFSKYYNFHKYQKSFQSIFQYIYINTLWFTFFHANYMESHKQKA